MREVQSAGLQSWKASARPGHRCMTRRSPGNRSTEGPWTPPEGIQVEPRRLDLPDRRAAQAASETHGQRHERRVSKRLTGETIDRLVAEYRAGTTAAELGRQYGLAKNSVLYLVRQAGDLVRHPRLSAAETAQLVAAYEAGLSQKDIAERLGRSPSGVWHCLRRLLLI
jgi:hypothetical protein